MKAERTANGAEETHTGVRAAALVRAIFRPGAGEPNAGCASRRPPESLRPAWCEPPAPGQKRPARLQAALTRTAAPARHAAAGLLVVFACLLAVSTAAQAQTVPDPGLEQRADGPAPVLRIVGFLGGNQCFGQAQGFTYGRQRGWVHAVFGPGHYQCSAASATDAVAKVSIYEATASGTSGQQPVCPDQPGSDCERPTQYVHRAGERDPRPRRPTYFSRGGGFGRAQSPSCPC